jgi:hypothetical protein
MHSNLLHFTVLAVRTLHHYHPSPHYKFVAIPLASAEFPGRENSGGGEAVVTKGAKEISPTTGNFCKHNFIFLYSA